MESDSYAVFLAEPITIGVAAAILFGLSWLHYRSKGAPPPVGPRRLLLAYLAVFGVCVAISAFSSYVPQGDAAAKWNVESQFYWQAQANAFVTELVLFTYVTLFEVALLGVPLVFALARRGRATVPLVLSITSVFALVLAVLLTVGNNPAFSHLPRMFAFVLPTHLLIALAFCLGAGIPWKVQGAQ